MRTIAIIVAVLAFCIWLRVRGDLTASPVVDAQIIEGPFGRELWIFRRSGSGVKVERVALEPEPAG